LLYFCKLFKLNATLVYNALKILEQQNYMQLSEGVALASRLIFRVDKSEVYRFEVAHSAYSPLIKSLLRTYGGILDHYSKISEEQLARLIGQSKEAVIKQLLYLHKQKVLTYIPSSDKPTITLLTERLHENNLLIDSRFIQLRKEVQEAQLKAMLNYTEQDKICRQVVVCAYFYEKEVPPCGKCDVCLDQKNKLDTDKNFEIIKQDILGKTKNTFIPIEKIIPENAFYKKEQYKKVIRFMLDERMLMMNEQNEIKAV
jgi:ATP-dependent DNA helicase RecQ